MRLPTVHESPAPIAPASSGRRNGLVWLAEAERLAFQKDSRQISQQCLSQ
jgi:hypothetical protein